MTPLQLYRDTTKIDWQQPVVIDFESYYDKEYSLSKITTERYIRGDEWECIGVSVKVGGSSAKFYRREEGIQVIAELVKRMPRSPFVAHNCAFDMPILAWRYGIHPVFTVDTAVMAKLCGLDRVAGGASLAKLSDKLEQFGVVNTVKGTTVHNMLGVHAVDMTERQWLEYADYCVLDSELCYALYSYMINKVPVSELIMSDITTKMYTTPAFDLDAALLESYATRLAEEREAILGGLVGKLGFTDNDSLLTSLRSAKKFSAILTDLGVTPPTKWSEKQEKLVPALSKTDTEFLALLEHENELVRALVETKLGVMSSMEQTRTATFLDIASRGLAPIYLRYAAAHTGRYGGGQATNYQNLSKRTKDPVLRRSMRAAKGHVILASDSSQIECRINAFISGQKDLTQLFLDGRDPYVDMATAIFNKPYDDILHAAKVEGTKEGKKMRNLGKEAVLACGYGMSATTFRTRMELTGNSEAAEMADDIVKAYRVKNNMIFNFWKQCDRVLATMCSGGSCLFGGTNNSLFFADGGSEFHGVKIPSIRFPNGTYIWYQNLRQEPDDTGRLGYVYDQFKGRSVLSKRIWGSSLVENLCQSLAFDVLKYQAIEIAKTGCPINLNVHDEWVSVVPRERAGEFAAAHYKIMKTVPEYLPTGLLDCEVDVGANYADLKTINMEKFLC